jgi:predicted phage gp36 major capsid-like protein
MQTTETKAAYMEKMQGMLREAEADLKKLETQVDRVKAEARAKHQQHVEDLRAKMTAAQAKLQELRTAEHAQWEKAKGELDHAWSHVKESIRSAASKL